MNKTIINSVLIAMAILIVLAVAVLGLSGTGLINNTTNTKTQTNNDVQEVRMSLRGVNYILSPATVHSGKVRITADNSVAGCMRDFRIPSLGVAKYLSSTDNSVTFDVEKEGNYAMTCSMGMGRGTLIVSNDGNTIQTAGAETNQVVTNTANNPAVTNLAGSTCGAKAGGCGCGGRAI